MPVNNGRAFEKIVRVIHEALKDSENTKIYTNYKIEDKTKSAKKREFDIFIISYINGYEIKVAIECKDYRKPVGVEKIEAFNSKCSSIKGINKKIMVSPKGFQSGAAENALELYDIEIYNLEIVDEASVHSWLDLESINRLRSDRNIKEVLVTLNESIVLKAGSDELPYGARVTTIDGFEARLIDVIIQTYSVHEKEIAGFFSIEAFKRSISDNIREVSLLGEKVVYGSNTKMWLKDDKDIRYYITTLKYLIEYKAVIDKPDSVNVRKYKKHGDFEKASLITADFPNDNSSIQFVKDKENDTESAFFIDDENVVRKLDIYGSFSLEKD